MMERIKPESGFYVDGRDVVAELCREFTDIVVSNREHWSRQKDEQGITVDLSLHPESAIIKSAFTLPISPIRAFEEFLSDPRKAPQYDIFIREVDLVERLNRMSGMYVLKLVTPAGARYLPLFHTIVVDSFSHSSMAIWRSVDADESWISTHILPKAMMMMNNNTTSSNSLTSPTTTNLRDIEAWKVLQETGFSSFDRVGIGCSGFLVQSDPTSQDKCIVTHLLHLVNIDPNDLRGMFRGLHSTHIYSNLSNMLVNQQQQVQTNSNNPNNSISEWEKEEQRLEFELCCSLTTPLRGSDYLTISHYRDRNIRFKFNKTADGGLIFVIRGILDTDVSPEVVIPLLLGDSSRLSLTSKKTILAKTSGKSDCGVIVHRQFHPIISAGALIETTMLDVIKTKGLTKICALRSVNYPNPNQQQKHNFIEFLPSGFFVNSSPNGGGSAGWWLCSMYISPEFMSNPEQSDIFSKIAVNTIGLCAQLQSVLTGSGCILDVHQIDLQVKNELKSLSFHVAPEISAIECQQIFSIFSDLIKFPELSGTSRAPLVGTPSPIYQFYKRERNNQTELVFVSEIVFVQPNITPPIDGRPFLFLKRITSSSQQQQQQQIQQPSNVRQKLEDYSPPPSSLTPAYQKLYEEKPVFDLLPDNLIGNIISFLPIETISSVACTCKRMKTVVTTPSIWEKIYYNRQINKEILQSNNPNPIPNSKSNSNQPINFKKACLESSAIWKSWKTKQYKQYALDQCHSSRVNCILFADQGRCIISGGSDRIVKIWKTGHQSSFSCINTFSGIKAGVVGLSVTPKFIFAGYRNGQVRIWDSVDWKLLYNHQPIHHTDGYLFSHPQMVSWEEDINVWDEETAMQIASLTGHTRKVVGVDFYTQNILVSCSLDRTIKVWDKRNSRCSLSVRGMSNGATCLSIYQTYTLATCCGDGSIQIWDIRRLGSGPVLMLKEHRAPVRCLKYGFGRLFSGSDDNSVRVWDACTYQCQQIFDEETTPITCLDVQNNAICMGSATGVIRTFEFSPFSQNYRPQL